jgi:hypothetical protein
MCDRQGNIPGGNTPQIKPVKPERTFRSHEENQERYVYMHPPRLQLCEIGGYIRRTPRDSIANAATEHTLRPRGEVIAASRLE